MFSGKDSLLAERRNKFQVMIYFLFFFFFLKKSFFEKHFFFQAFYPLCWANIAAFSFRLREGSQAGYKRGEALWLLQKVSINLVCFPLQSRKPQTSHLRYTQVPLHRGILKHVTLDVFLPEIFVLFVYWLCSWCLCGKAARLVPS